MTGRSSLAPTPNRAAGSQPVRLIVTRRIPLPADTVFAALVDLDAPSRWILATRVSAAPGDPAGPRPPRVGSTILARTGLGAIAVHDTMRVDHYQPPRRWRVRHTGSVVRGWGEWGVLPGGGECRVYWAEEFELPGGRIGRMGWLVAGILVRWGIRVSLSRLDRGLRSGRLVGVAGARHGDETARVSGAAQ